MSGNYCEVVKFTFSPKPVCDNHKYSYARKTARLCVSVDNVNEGGNDDGDDESATVTTPPNKRRRRDDDIETLIDSGLYAKALNCMRLVDEKVCMSVLQDSLRRVVVVEKEKRDKFHSSTPPTLENLLDCIELGRDDNSVDLLQRGARLDYSRRSFGALLDLCESREMPRTVSYIINNNLLPASLGIEYFVAALYARNAPLAFHLLRYRGIREALQMIDDNQRRLYRAKYCYAMFKYLTYNAIDCVIFQQSCNLLDLAEFSDDDFLLLMRRGDILTQFSDEQVIAMRKRTLFNPFGAASCLAPLAEWLYNDKLSNSSKSLDASAVAVLQLQFLEQLDLVLNSRNDNTPGSAYLRSIFMPIGLMIMSTRAA